MDHDTNVIGAAVLALGDRMREAVEAAAGRGGAHPPALVALHEWAGGVQIDALARGLGLSHSRTVRVIDTLVHDGLALRRKDPDDGRGALIELTLAGRSAARATLDARARALEEALSCLSPQQRSAVASPLRVVLVGAATDRDAVRIICRLCDTTACGHQRGRCPSTEGADQAERAAGAER